MAARLNEPREDARHGARISEDSRDVQDRLNEVCGLDWQMRHPWSTGSLVACEIGIKVDGEWIWRGDGAGESEVDESLSGPRKEQQLDMARKAAFSDSFKRAAVRFGIGRYLYDLDAPWVEVEARGRSYVIPDRELTKLRALLGKQANVEPPQRPAAKLPPAYPSREPATPQALADAAQRVVAEAKARQGPAPHVPLKDHPKRAQALEAWKRIKTAIDGARTPGITDEIMSVNDSDLQVIRDVNPPTYDDLWAMAEAKKAELIGATA